MKINHKYIHLNRVFKGELLCFVSSILAFRVLDMFLCK